MGSARQARGELFPCVRDGPFIGAVLIDEVELAFQNVTVPWLEVLEGDFVDKLYLRIGGADLLACAVGERRAYAYFFVVEGPEMNHASLAGNGEARGYEPAPLVCGAPELLELIDVVEQCPTAMVRGCLAEPDSRTGIELLVVDGTAGVHGLIVRVCLLVCREDRAVKDAVLVGDGDVGLSRRRGGDAERDVGHAALTVLVGLHERDIPADGQVLGRGGEVGVDGLCGSLRGYVHDLGAPVGEVTPGSLRLRHRDGAERKRFTEPGRAVLRGPHGPGLCGPVG